MIMKRHRLFLVATLFVAACNNDSKTTPVLRSQSQVVLQTPPETYFAGVFGAWSWETHENTAQATFYPSSAQLGNDVSLDLPGTAVMAADTILKDDTWYFVVGTIDQSASSSLYRYVDDNGSGTPDASTETLLLSTTGPEYITSFTEGENGSLYLLDRRCQDVLLARDTDSDGWADSLQATPFALAQDFPDLLNGRYLVAHGANQVRVYRLQPPPGLLGMMPYHLLIDSDADGIADEIQARTAPAADVIVTYGHPYEGQMELRVLGADNRSVEVWELDSSNQPTTMLGSGQLNGDGDVTVSLSRTLVLGEGIGVRYQGDPTSLVTRPVNKNWPEIIETDPKFIETGSAATVTIEGNGFASNMDVYLRDPDGDLQSLTFTFVNTNKANVSVPSLSTAGSATLYAVLPTQEPEEDGARLHNIQVCVSSGE